MEGQDWVILWPSLAPVFSCLKAWNEHRFHKCYLFFFSRLCTSPWSLNCRAKGTTDFTLCPDELETKFQTNDLKHQRLKPNSNVWRKQIKFVIRTVGARCQECRGGSSSRSERGRRWDLEKRPGFVLSAGGDGAYRACSGSRARSGRSAAPVLTLPLHTRPWPQSTYYVHHV